MRRELQGGEDDNETLARKLHSGYLGTQSAFLTSETPIDPEIQAFMDQTRASTRADFNGLNTKFQASVNKIGKSATSHLTNINSQLSNLTHGGNTLNGNMVAQGKTLNNIHLALNKYGRKFDALQVASQAQQAGSAQPTRSRSLSPPAIPTTSTAPSGMLTPAATTSSSSSTSTIQPVSGRTRSSTTAQPSLVAGGKPPSTKSGASSDTIFSLSKVPVWYFE